MAFQFGAPSQPTTQPGTTGFALPQPQQQQPKPAFGFAPASSTGFNFGAQGATAGSTGFTFCTPATTTSASTGLTFGAPANTSASTGFSFGAQPSVPSGGFTFGQSAAAAPPNTTFGFGQAPAAAPAAAPAPAAPTTGLLFGAPNATAVSSGFNFGTPAPGVTPTAATTTASLGFPFSSTPTSTLSFAAPSTTSASGGFTFGTVPMATSTVTGFAVVTTQPSSSTSSSFTFGQKTTAPIGSGFAFNASSAPASTTPVASNTTGSLPFSSTAPTFVGGFSFATTKPSAITAPSGFTFPAPPTTVVSAAAAGGSVFTPAQLTTTSVLKPPETFQGTSSTTPSATALGASLATNSAPPMGFNLNTTPGIAFNAGPPASFLTTDGTKSAGFAFPVQPSSTSTSSTGFAFPLQQATSASTTGTANFVGTPSAATASSNTAVIKPTISFTAPAMSVAPAPFSQADQAKKPSLTTTAAATTAVPTCAPSSIASGFSFPTPAMPATFTPGLTSGFSTATGSSLKALTTTSAPSLLSTTIPFSSAPSPFGGFSATTSVSLSTATTVTASSAAGATLTTTTTVTPASAAPPPTMNFRQLEDIINKWKLELEEQERVFLNQATQVNAWDKLLISNGEKITELNEAVERVKLDQQRLDHELDFILAQQRELEDLLVPLEKSLESTPNIHHQQHADLEREHTYRLAENIDAQLKRMAEDIKEIIEHLNSSNKGQDDSDPTFPDMDVDINQNIPNAYLEPPSYSQYDFTPAQVQQIAKILNAHMDALQWVDQNTAVLRRKLDETSKLYESHR